MAIYITVEDVDAALGADWAEPAAKPLAVQMANDWMAANAIPVGLEDDRITRAGAYLAKMAAEGTLYADTKGDIKRKRVKAGSVESETEFMDGTKAVSGELSYAKDLLRPWLNPLGNARLLKRL